MQPKISLPLSQEPKIVPYPEPQRYSSHLHNLIYKMQFSVIVQCLRNFSQYSLPLAISCIKYL